jgi:uncharacterized RDD family membrane protein YckC
VPLVVAVIAAPVIGSLTDVDDRRSGLYVGLVAVTVYWVYETLLTARTGQTWGKRLAGLRVVGTDGLLPSMGRSALRALPVVLIAIPGFWLLTPIAYGWLLFHTGARGLHDLVARTYVVPLRWLDSKDTRAPRRIR